MQEQVQPGQWKYAGGEYFAKIPDGKLQGFDNVGDAVSHSKGDTSEAAERSETAQRMLQE
jgi:hypothetical protein